MKNNKILENTEYEIALMRCPDCRKEQYLSIYRGENIRNTYCIKCGHAVIWEKIGEGYE